VKCTPPRNAFGVAVILWYNGYVSTSNNRPLHIGLNAHLLSTAPTYRSAGINTYIRNLLIHLPQVEENLRYTAFLSDRGFTAVPGLVLRRSSWSTVNPIVRIAWEQLIQPWALWRERVDLAHALAFVGPLVTPCPLVVTIFDLSFLRFPERFRLPNRLYLRWFTRLTARRARRIIAISRHTKRDVVSLLGVPEGRVDVVYCGVSVELRPRPQEEVDAFRRQHGLPERFILYLGTLEPRKNISGLLRAFAQARRRQFIDSQVKLVVAGAKGWHYKNIFALVEREGLQDDVLFPGYVPEEKKVWWYNAACCFVYPSLYEGFGLPPLEAMACGTPVIVSNAASLPEVGGEAAILVDPHDAEELSQALGEVLGDAGRREEMRRRGLEQAQRFSWLETARQTVQVYRRVLEDHRPSGFSKPIGSAKGLQGGGN